MNLKKEVVFGGVAAAPGTKNQGWCPIPGTDCVLPVTVVNGAGEGKTVLITSAIHGCEYPSIEAVFRFAETVDPAQVTGQIVIVNPVNVDGFLTRTPYLVPRDGKNLNRLFPGDPEGSLGDRIAWVLTEEFQKKCDFHLDTHGGDIPESQFSYAYYPGVSEYPEALRIARESADYVLNAEFVVKSAAINHAYNYATLIGIPSLMLELGQTGTWSEEEVRQYLENIENVLRWLKVLPGEAMKRQKPVRDITRGVYLDAEASGRWYPFVTREDTVKAGQKIGEIRDLFGKVLKEYYAEFDGIVLMVTVSLAVREGDPILSYGA